eukprot:TRINITY_DN2145_c0_g1_i1.p1 TRINITY_DN2145_c0_g1~~TRINITY_DN2145_c0_g1_i1.p1  ORF type:complete len:136 (-),score=60.94 TRINITY_DN2145_c0_g1_i1:121-471(-)
MGDYCGNIGVDPAANNGIIQDLPVGPTQSTTKSPTPAPTNQPNPPSFSSTYNPTTSFSLTFTLTFNPAFNPTKSTSFSSRKSPTETQNDDKINDASSAEEVGYAHETGGHDDKHVI